MARGCDAGRHAASNNGWSECQNKRYSESDKLQPRRRRYWQCKCLQINIWIVSLMTMYIFISFWPVSEYVLTWVSRDIGAYLLFDRTIQHFCWAMILSIIILGSGGRLYQMFIILCIISPLIWLEMWTLSTTPTPTSKWMKIKWAYKINYCNACTSNESFKSPYRWWL